MAMASAESEFDSEFDSVKINHRPAIKDPVRNPSSLESPRRDPPALKYGQTVVPAVAYTPTYGLILGAAYFYYLLKPEIQLKAEPPILESSKNKEILQRPGDYIGVNIAGTFKPNFMLNFDYWRWANFPVVFKTWVLVSTFFAPYYGEGGQTRVQDRVDSRQVKFKLRPEFQYHWNRRLATSLLLDIRIRRDGGLYSDPDRQVLPNESTTGLGFSLAYDSRDNKFSPQSSQFHQFNIRMIPSTWTSYQPNLGFVQADLDLRIFRNIGATSVWAGRIFTGASTGKPTYMFRYDLGGDETLRGYLTNRFRGKLFYLAQSEFRLPVWKSISGVVANEFGDITDDKFRDGKFTTALGLRFGLPPDGQMKLRLDFAFARDQHGVFFSFGEVF